MSASYHIGAWGGEYPENRGWFVGTFMEKAPVKTDALEAKFWRFPEGRTDHAPKIQRLATELTILLKGKIRGFVGEDPVELSAGQFIVMPPGLKNNIVEEVLEAAEGISIKSPSLPEDIQR